MIRHQLSIALALIALLFGLNSNALAQGDSYVRFRSGESSSDGALETAVSRYRHPTKNIEVVLYGAVHIADQAYFDAVQEDLDGYDVVLYEGVGVPGEEPPAWAKDLGGLQKFMGDAMGLTFQKEGIDYTGANFVHADMSLKQLSEAMGGHTISPFGQLLSEDQVKKMMPFLKGAQMMLKGFFGRNKPLQDRMKLMMAQQLANGDISSALGSKMAKAILYDRNDVVYTILEKQLRSRNKGSIAIFYGAAHHPDFVKRLVKDGFSKIDKRWMPAWQLGEGVEESKSVQRKPHRRPRRTAKKKRVPTGPTPGKGPQKGKSRWF